MVGRPLAQAKRAANRSPFVRTEPCACGHDHVGCAGHRKATGEPCKRKPIEGGNVCLRHGGSIPAVQEKAAARLAVHTYGLPRDIHPAQALLEEVMRSAGHVAWLAQKVAELDPDALVWGITTEHTRPRKEAYGVEAGKAIETTREAKVNVWLDLYLTERKHLAAVSRDALAAGIQERQVQVLEMQAKTLVSVIKMILADVRLGIEASPEVQSSVVRDALRMADIAA